MDHDFNPCPTADDGPSADDKSAALPASCRHDGWTGFARRLFLEVLAETGRVSRACEYARLSPQSAYALRNRDPLFACGWDAACALARNPLADALREQAIDGLTETIRRDGEIVAERHRHDSRLSIAVLHRLDKRCDRAEERGAAHLPLIARWDEWLGHIGRGEDSAALALLESAHREDAPDHQLHQLPLRENPTGAGAGGDAREDDEDHGEPGYWQDEQGIWTTDFPPPPGFDGVEHGSWGSPAYRRHCTAQETDLLIRLECLDQRSALEEAEEQRDNCVADMIADLAERADLLAYRSAIVADESGLRGADLPPDPSPA